MKKLQIPHSEWKRYLSSGLAEDGWALDWTSIGTEKDNITAKLISKADGSWAGSALLQTAQELSKEMGFPFHVESNIPDGETIRPGEVIAVWRGASRGIFGLERPVLNLAGYVSGIATATRRLVDL